MTVANVALFAVLIAAAILVRANDHLDGVSTPRIGLYLRALIFGCFLAPLVLGQWKTTLVLLALWAVLIQPIAIRFGARLVVFMNRRRASGPFERWVGLPAERLTRITRRISANAAVTPTDIASFLERGKERDFLRTAALDLALGQPRIQAVLSQFNASRSEVEEAFAELEAYGFGPPVMGHCLPYSIAYYPRPLAVVLAWKAHQLPMSQGEMAELMYEYFRLGHRLPAIPR